MTTSITSPFPLFVGLDGLPLNDGYIYIGLENQNPETHPAVVYWDEAMTIQAVQPLRTQSGHIYRTGTPANIYASGNFSITARDKNSRLVWSKLSVADAVANLIADLASSATALTGAGLVGRNAALSYPVGTVGSALAGVICSSEYANLPAALAAAAGLTLRVVGANVITAALVPANNTTIIIEAGASITGNVANMILLDCSGKTNVNIYGPGKLQNTATGTTGAGGTVGIVSFNGATDCTIDGVQIIGQTWAGILLNTATRCRVLNNKISGAIGTLQDSADIMIYNDASSNLVQGNYCLSGSHTGIMIQDPYNNTLPTANRVIANWITSHTAYGIAVYIAGPSGNGNTNNVIQSNWVTGALGSYATNRDSGSGIYVVGKWAGGTQIIGNTVLDSCAQTLTRSLAPGGIGLNGIASGCARPVIASNTIVAGVQGDGINVSSCNGGAVIDGNTIYLPSTNNGTGVGGATVVGSGIRVENSSFVAVTPGSVEVAGTGFGVVVYANGANMADVVISGAGTVKSNAGAPLAVINNGAFTVTDFIAQGFRCLTASDTPYGVQLSNIVRGSVDVTCTCGTTGAAQAALRVSGCTQLRVRGSYVTTGSVAVSAAGTCTGSLLDASAYWGTSASLMSNGATGLRVEWYGATAAPAAGTWAVGDRTIRSPSVGQPKAWVCTAAGTPGTHTSEGNL